MIFLILLMLISDVNAAVLDKSGSLDYYSEANIEKITRELKDKTGIELIFVIEKNVDFNKNYIDSILKDKGIDNKLFVFIDELKNRSYSIQGKKVDEGVTEEKVKYILDNSLSDKNIDILSKKIVSTTAILAKNISDEKNVSLESLKGIFVKPLDSFFYSTTEKFPFNIVVKLFYANPIVFISLFVALSWGILVRCSEILWGEKGAKAGNILWKLCLFLTFCIIIVRVGVDYNEYLGSIGAALVLFLPVAVVVSAVFRDDIQEFCIKFFGWE